MRLEVGVGDAADVIDRFKADSRAEWLGFFVAGDQKYNRLLGDVLARADILDIISGSEIDLFLFGTAVSLSPSVEGKRIRSIGGDGPPPPKIKQDWLKVSSIGEVNRSAVGVKQITKASVEATHKIVELLGLGVDDLPSLALIRKDFDYTSREPKLILPTRGQADAEFLIEFIRSMRRVLENHRKATSILLSSDSQAPNRPIEEINRFPELLKNVERGAAFFSKVLGSSGLELEKHSLTAAILNAPSFEQGLRDAMAQQGVDFAKLEKILQNDSEARRLQLQLNESRAQLLSTVGYAREYVSLCEIVDADLEELVARFERKISFRITANYFRQFFKFSTEALSKAKTLINLAAAVKSGGLSLFT